MLALISQRINVDSYGNHIDVLEENYIKYFENMGFDCIPISNFIKNTYFLDKLNPDLIVLSGGGSVPQNYYGYVDNELSARDKIEIELINIALKKKIPILGICRGMQFINGYFGGKVSQLKDFNCERKPATEHEIKLNNEIFTVNHYHNDGILVQDLHHSFEVLAIDINYAIVEAYVGIENRILGVQWHPERTITDSNSKYLSNRIIEEFIFGKRGIEL